jgi:hypothetical protein
MNARVEDHDRHVEDWYPKIESLFVGRLALHRIDELYTHVKGCDRCERVFNRFASAEKRLFGRPKAISPFAAERVRGRLFHRDGAPRARLPVLGFVSAVVASIALLAVFVPRAFQASNEFGSRGANEANAIADDASFRALAVSLDAKGSLEVRDLASGRQTLAPSTRVKLVYSNFGAYAYASVAVIDSSGSTIVAVPPMPIDRNVVDAELGRAIAIPDDAAKGPIEIVARFSTTPGPASKDDLVRVVKAEIGPSVEGR